MPTFPTRLHELRNTTPFSQKKMAEELGIVFRSYRRYESGESDPTLTTMLKIAEYFNVSLDYLAGRTDEP